MPEWPVQSEEAKWEEFIYQFQLSDPLFGGPVIDPVTKQGIDNFPLMQLANRTAWLKKQFEEITVEDELIVEVGSNGDFASINAALKELSRSRPVYTEGAFTAEIRIKSGEALEEQVFVAGIDLSWIKITSEDAEVPIVRSALTTVLDSSLGGAFRFPAFGAKLGGVLPFIATHFEMDTSGSAADRAFIMCVNSGKAAMIPGAGCRNVADRALYANRSSIIDATGGIFPDAGEYTVEAQRGSRISCFGSDLANGSIECGYGSIIEARNVSGNPTMNIAPNTVTDDGIIFN